MHKRWCGGTIVEFEQDLDGSVHDLQHDPLGLVAGELAPFEDPATEFVPRAAMVGRLGDRVVPRRLTPSLGIMTAFSSSPPPIYTWLDFNSPLSAARAAGLVDRLGRSGPATVLDLGCGWGELMLQVLAAVPGFLERELKQPVHLAFSYDEEVGCLGVRPMLAELERRAHKPALCLIGEPTEAA